MSLEQIIILGLIQGITEFLPISSSAHLALLPHLVGWEDQGLGNDIAAHLGTLLAVIIYFRKQIRGSLVALAGSDASRAATPERRLIGLVLLATVPTAVLGYLLHDFAGTVFRDPLIIASTTIVFGGILWLADVKGSRVRDEDTVTLKDALLIGLMQALALVPGTSRAGITMTAGLMLGLTRQAAARFSFMLAIPIIALASAYEIYKLYSLESQSNPVVFSLIALIAFASAYLTIHFFIKFLDRTGMLPYVIYRVAFGLVLFAIFL